jgi:dTDP-D-glucose 4,6-dehydratase
MDPTKAERELSWKAKYTIKEGLKKTIKWHKKNRKMLSHLKNIYVYKQWLAIQLLQLM